MANIFRAKHLVSRTGTFSHEVTAPNLVYNTGDQTISGFKDFRDGIYLNSEDDVVSFGTKIIGSVSGIELSSFQNPTDITIRKDFVGGNYNDIISVHNYAYTDSIFGQSINSATLGDQIVIYQTGSSFGVPLSKGPYLRLGENNIISEKNSSKLGIGTLFPEEKVHISGGNLRVENNLLVSGTGIFNALDLNNIDNLSLSGIDISITDSTVNVYNNILISGNPVLTGTTLVQTGVNLQNQISSLSGSLNSSGVVLINTISSLSGNVVFLTGDQIINGLKTFTSGIDIYSGNSPQTLRIFNSTGTNSGEFGLFGWQNNGLIVGPQQTNSGVLRDMTLTGRNININASGVFNIFDTTNISGNLNVTGNIKGSDLLKIGKGLDVAIFGAYGLFTSEVGENAGFTINRGDNSSYASLDFLKEGDASFGWSIQSQPGSEDLTIVDRVNSSNLATFQVGGNVGIGTVSPSAKLHVSGGDLKVDGNIYLSGNSVLTGVDLSNYATKSLAIAYAIAL